MNPNELLTTLSQKGVILSIVDGKLKVKAPRGSLSEEFKQAISKNKEQILASIRTRNELARTYRILGENYGAEDWNRLAATSGWKDRLDELEEAFSMAWTEGRDGWQEFEALRDHWRAGIRAIKTSKAA